MRLRFGGRRLLRVFLQLRPLSRGMGALFRDLAVRYLVYLGLECP